MELIFSSQDPIFGLIIIFAALLLTALASYFWGVFSNKKQSGSIEQFVQKFQSSESGEVDEFLTGLKPNLNLLKSLAAALQKVGNFEQVIAVYNYALLQSKETIQRREILILLGKTYLKAGFLKRAEASFLACLQFGAREEEALRYLCLVYERLKEYKKCLEVLDSLQEFGSDTRQSVAFVKAAIIFENKALSPQEKLDEIRLLSKEFAILKRMEVLLCKKSGLALIDPTAKYCLDLIWQDEAPSGCEDEWSVRAVEALKRGGVSARLEFSYVCNECKHASPLFFYRCQSCARLASVEICSKIVEDDGAKSNYLF